MSDLQNMESADQVAHCLRCLQLSDGYSPKKGPGPLQIPAEWEPISLYLQEAYRESHYFEYSRLSGTRQKWRPL